tara:strand:+ start:3430 stop:3669 length:240 start_codon:yes stop_codon:yes gene_type:complete
MKAQLQTNKGKLTIDIPVINRYKVVAKTATTSADWTQFWTWLRYEMRIDYNVNQKVIGCNAFNLSKIKKQWSSKFYFDK